MPEIPDLEAIRHYLMPRLEGLTITEAEAPLPWLVRTGAEEFGTLAGHGFGEIHRMGKFLIWFVDDGRLLVVNPMLTGRFHWVEKGTRKPAMLGVVLRFDDGHEVRYSDMRRMGRWYLVPGDGLNQVPQMATLGPDAMAISEEEFLTRLKPRRGQIKATITNQEFMAGIGNAYSDEILWAAGLHPHRRRATMDEGDLRRLYRSMREVLKESIAIVDATVQGEGLGKKEEWRQHLKVHRRAGEPCPKCGTEIRGQVRSGSETNYCLTCQPLFE
ncbi:MAG: Fpg/Nei family DNA glycosylase [Dehalococcoidia bacterium]|nr:MAG: Fpg/Nei family DNA glycosylase [Dehalococcoidia bacterium]